MGGGFASVARSGSSGGAERAVVLHRRNVVDESVWGKSRGLDPALPPYPLVRHLLDAAAMALHLWDVYGAAVLVHPASTEQGYAIRTAGTRRRVPADFDGLTLIRMTAAPKVKEMQSPS
ncbi:type I-E CRISPR-associated endoribonuclease Cas2 [Streptomyces sp. NPDC017413]|uniref:type I-E CRISPR-associated endoribonuclease Cas2 n=1 Tax=Streptomyces sp. NPDC017413 TaxID=3364994 RepID=UPI00378C30B0